MNRRERNHHRYVAWITLLASVVLWSTSARVSYAQTSQATQITLVIDRKVDDKFLPADAEVLSDYFVYRLFKLVPEIKQVTTWELGKVLEIGTAVQGLGGTDYVDEAVNALGSEFSLRLMFREVGPRAPRQRYVDGTLVSSHTGQVIRRFTEALPQAYIPACAVLDRALSAMAVNLVRDLGAERLLPVRPSLSLPIVSPVDVAPGGTISVSVILTDEADHSPQPGYDITFRGISRDGAVLVEVLAITIVTGEARTTMNVSDVPGLYYVQARFVRSDGLPENSWTVPYRVVAVSGGMSISAPEAALRVGAGETVAAQLMRNGVASAGEAIAFAASGGGTVSAASAVTDSAGRATTAYQAPATNAVVDVTATAPAGASATTQSPPTQVIQQLAPGDGPAAAESSMQSTPPPLTAVLTFVVDGAVAFTLHAANTVEGGTTQVIADLSIGGTTFRDIPVTFTLSGPGQLSASATPTDASGRAEVIYFAPTANASVTVTAAAVIDGQTYTRTVTIAVGAVTSALSVIVDSAGVQFCTPTLSPPSQPLPLSISASDCGSQISLTVRRVGNEVQVDVDLDEAADQYMQAGLLLTITPPRAGTLDVAINTGWAISAPDPYPGGVYFLFAQAYALPLSIPAVVYDFTNKLVPPPHANPHTYNVSGPTQLSISLIASNNAANVGRGRLVTITFR